MTPPADSPHPSSSSPWFQNQPQQHVNPNPAELRWLIYQQQQQKILDETKITSQQQQSVKQQQSQQH